MVPALVTELHEMALPLGRKKLISFLKIENLLAIQPKRFVPRTTDIKHGKGLRLIFY